MQPPTGPEAVQEAAERLAELLGVPAVEPRFRGDTGGSGRIEAVVALGGRVFVLHWLPSGAPATVARALGRVGPAAALGGRVLPLLSAPFMGPGGRRRCEAAEVAWLDLCGNARITAPGLRVLVEGRANRFRRRGRPSSPFAPKSARIARWLLVHPEPPVTQRRLAEATGMDEGFTSRIVSRLVADGLVRRAPDGTLRVPDPDLLLDAWLEDHDFSKHRILRGRVSAGAGGDPVGQVAEALREAGVKYALTGATAAALMAGETGAGPRAETARGTEARAATARGTEARAGTARGTEARAGTARGTEATFYVAEAPSTGLLDRLGFQEDPRGADLWLVVPRDPGVFEGAAEHDGVCCVHPVQAWLDLQARPVQAW